MTTHTDIWQLMKDEMSETGLVCSRDEVLSALARAFIAAFDDEDEETHPKDSEILDDDEAHSYYCDCYYTLKGYPDPRQPGDGYLERNPVEVSVPDWMPRNHRRLLRWTAQWERSRDEAMMRACRALQGVGP